MIIKNEFKKNEIIFLISFISLLVLLHSLIAPWHYQECDSSNVYKYLTDSSIYSQYHFLVHIKETSKIIFYPFRIIVGLFAEYLPLQALREGILLSLKTTYPILSGILYGLNIPNTLDEFSNFASFINILAISIGILLLYKASVQVGVSKVIAFSFCFGMLNLYSVNAYSYHFGSTIWYIFGSCLCIYSSVYYQFKRSKVTYPIALMSSYPALIFFLCQFISTYIINNYKNIIIYFNKKTRKYILPSLRAIYHQNLSSIYTFIIILICFFPFNSATRTSFDYRGFFTPFALFPLYKSLDHYTIALALSCFSLVLITYCYYFYRKGIFQRNNSNIYALNNAVNVISLNFFVIFILVFIGRFTFSTTRHALFLLPYIIFLSSIGLQSLFYDIFSLNKKIIHILNLILLAMFCITFISSLYSSYLRLDPLKVIGIPMYIREFSSNNPSDTMTLLDCDTHYLYNNFTEKRATYDKATPSLRVPLNHLGRRLLVAQRINQDTIKNFTSNLKEGDELITEYNEVTITLEKDPYIINNKIYFDSMNYKKNSVYPNEESNPFSRPNSIYIFPISVIPSQ